jgi:parvulin-like peptidyl-prolyl isomerase
MKTSLAKTFPIAVTALHLALVLSLAQNAVGQQNGDPSQQELNQYYPNVPRTAYPGQLSYGVAPTPSNPAQAVRPDSWPTGSAPSRPAVNNPYSVTIGRMDGASSTGGQMVPGQMPGQLISAQMAPGQGRPQSIPVAIPCDGAIMMGRVGTEAVLSSDVLASEDEFANRFKGRVTPEQFELQKVQLTKECAAGVAQLAEHWNAADPGSFVDAPRRILLTQMIGQIVEYKMLYLDFLRTVPKEALPNIEETVGRHFDDTELAVLLKRENVQSREELENKLRAKGSSLEREKTAFTQRLIAQQWIREKVNPDKEITHDQMLEYYEKHKADYTTQPKTHWEELAVVFNKFPNKDAAYKALADMGNQVLAGAPFEGVAKTSSQGVTADKGGDRGWNTQGSLAAKAIDDLLFGNLEPGRLSPIVESQMGYHIIRVVERKELTITPFSKVQLPIKESIKKERLDKGYKDFVEKVRKQYPVWTIFDAANKKALEEAAKAGAMGGEGL